MDDECPHLVIERIGVNDDWMNEESDNYEQLNNYILNMIVVYYYTELYEMANEDRRYDLIK